MFKQHIDALKVEMEVILVRFTRIKRDGFDNVFKNYDESKEKELYDFLVDFRTNEYAELYRIFRLPLDAHQPDADGYTLWAKYFANGKTNLIEMQMFRTQARVCCDKWRTWKGSSSGKKKKSEGDENADPKNAERVSA